MSKNVTNHKKVVFEWGKKLGDPNKPYAIRWRLDFYWFSFRVHKWLCSDDSRAYHSHPVNMLIFVLRGMYADHWLEEGNLPRVSVYVAGDVRIIRRNYRHWVQILEKSTWTFLITWGSPKRWAFWLKNSLKRKTRDKYFIEHGQHVCD